jgi:hypothetical protein
MASFSELVGTALRAATHRVSEGSRRNARTALEARYETMRQSAEVMAALPDRAPSRTAVPHRNSA